MDPDEEKWRTPTEPDEVSIPMSMEDFDRQIASQMESKNLGPERDLSGFLVPGGQGDSVKFYAPRKYFANDKCHHNRMHFWCKDCFDERKQFNISMGLPVEAWGAFCKHGIDKHHYKCLHDSECNDVVRRKAGRAAQALYAPIPAQDQMLDAPPVLYPASDQGGRRRRPSNKPKRKSSKKSKKKSSGKARRLKRKSYRK